MSKNQQVEELLRQPCFVIDFLPQRVPAEAEGSFFEVEQFFLRGRELVLTAERFRRIILKMCCYYKHDVYLEQWLKGCPMEKLAGFIERIVVEKEGFMNILFAEENVLICLDSSCLYLAVYNPGPEVQKILSALAAAEGMFFWNRED